MLVRKHPQLIVNRKLASPPEALRPCQSHRKARTRLQIQVKLVSRESPGILNDEIRLTYSLPRDLHPFSLLVPVEERWSPGSDQREIGQGLRTMASYIMYLPVQCLLK